MIKKCTIILLCFSLILLAGCKSKKDINKNNSSEMTNSSNISQTENKNETNNKTENGNNVSQTEESKESTSSQVKVEQIDSQLESTVKNTNDCNIKYSINMTQLKGTPTVVNSTNNMCTYTSRMYKYNENLYIGISEYNGGLKYPYGAQGGKTATNEAIEVFNYVTEDTSNQGIIKNALGCEYSCSAYKTEGDISYFKCTKVLIGNNLPGEYAYAKGYIVVGVKSPILVWYLDLSENQEFDSQIENITKNIIDTLVIK